MRKSAIYVPNMPRGGRREGSGRKPLPEEKRRIRISVRVYPETWAKLKEKAKFHGDNPGQYLDRLMK